MTSRKTGKVDVLDFERTMAELEETVRRLETGDAPLEESLSAFERGVALVRALHHRLDAVQARIEELTQGRDGTLERRSVAGFSSDADEEDE